MSASIPSHLRRLFYFKIKFLCFYYHTYRLLLSLAVYIISFSDNDYIYFVKSTSGAVSDTRVVYDRSDCTDLNYDPAHLK